MDPVFKISPSLSSLDDGAMAEEEHEAFLDFLEYARSMLSSCGGDGDDDSGGGPPPPPWSWIVSRVLKTCVAYCSGVTAGILLSDLFQAWSEQHRYTTSKKKLEFMIPLKKRHRRTKFPTVTIDSIYEKNFLSPNSVLEAVVVDAFILPGTEIYMLSLGDMWSSCTVDLYLHRRYYDLVNPKDQDKGILKKGREIFLTGCCLRSAMEGSGQLRLLPTEYLVILLDEEQDEDALLLAAKFCSDSFSSVSLDAVKDYSFQATINSIRSLEPFGSTQRKEITLVDNDGNKLKFFLWGEQVILANLFSVGSTLAVDRPFIANVVDNNNEESKEFCLEYGSATQIYLLSLDQQEEQVVLASSQRRTQGSKLLGTLGQSQELKASQVTLPRNSQGSIDFSNYPLRLYVMDLHDKMTGISLYGVVTEIEKGGNISEAVFFVTIEDISGAIVAKLHFVRSWSLGRLGLGHTIFISGLSCFMTSKKLLEVHWFEKDSGTSLVNLSCLPALLNSPCFNKLSYLSDIPKIKTTHICLVRLEQIHYHDLRVRKAHVLCGRFVKEGSDGLAECSFCCCTCNHEIVNSFQLKVTLADETGKLLAWCTGQTAAELLQISPDEFDELPVVERAMYLNSYENESFMVSIVSSKRCSDESSVDSRQENAVFWEITRAQKCE